MDVMNGLTADEDTLGMHGKRRTLTPALHDCCTAVDIEP